MVAIGKKLGQLKQWTGEKFGTAERTNVSEDFRRFDLETESRKDGISKITQGLFDYAKTLDKRSSQDKKSSVLAILSKSLTQQGHFHGDESKIGLALRCVGEAHDRINVLQQDFAESIRQGLLAGITDLNESMKDYASLKKKLENRRLDYDAKLNKLNKSKKEKPGLEEEMKVAQKKYDETRNNVEELMSTFAEREDALLGPLLDFVESQHSYAEASLKCLVELKGKLSNEQLSKTIAEKSKNPDKASLLRRNSSLKTVMPAAMMAGNENRAETNNLPIQQPPTPEPTNIAEIGPPEPISNQSRGKRENGDLDLNNKVNAEADRSARASLTKQREEIVEAQYDFNAELAGEMSIKRGDLIRVTRKLDEGWWEGQLSDQKGLFPSNYVKPADSQIDQSSMRGSSKINGIPPTTVMQSKQVPSNSPILAKAKSRSTFPSAKSKCPDCSCSDFAANVFKPGKCNNCFHNH